MDSWQVLWANRVLWIGFSMIFLVVQTHLLYCMYEGENGVYIAVWPSCQTDDHQQDHILCKGSWDTYYSKLHFPIALSEGWSHMLPGTLIAGFLPLFAGRCLLEFSCASFYFVSFQFTHKTEAGSASPSQPEQRPQQLQQPQAQQLQKLYTTTFVTPWTCLMEGQETLSNGPYSWKIHKSLAQPVPRGMAWAWGAQWFWMESADSLYIEHADTWTMFLF